MTQLTFTNTSIGDKRTYEGELEEEGDALIFKRTGGGKPDFRIESDRSVTLLSANSEHEIEDFGENPNISGYCLGHNVNYDRLPDRSRCPYCRMEQDRQAEMVERATRHAPRSYDDCADIDAYRH